MENVGRGTGIELKTLNPQIPSFLHFRSSAPRRSHLQSTTYSCLVRIFQLLDESSPPPPPSEPLKTPNPNPNSDVAPPEEPGLLSTEEDPILNRSSNETATDELWLAGRREEHGAKDLAFGISAPLEELGHEKGLPEHGENDQLSEGLASEIPQLGDVNDETLFMGGESAHDIRHGEHDKSDDGGLLTNLFFVNPKLDYAQDEFFLAVEELGHDRSDSGAALTFDCPGLIETKDDLSFAVEGFQNGKIQVGNGELQEEMFCRNSKSFESKDRIFHLMEESEQGKQQELHDACAISTFQKVPAVTDPKLIDFQDEILCSADESGNGEKRQEQHKGCSDRELIKNMTSEMPTSVETRDENRNSLEELGKGLHQEKHIPAYNEIDSSRSMKLDEDNVRQFAGLANEGDLEEGEISDDSGISIQSLDLENEHSVFVNCKSNEGSVYDGFYKKGYSVKRDSTVNIDYIDGHIRSRENICNEDQSNLLVCGIDDSFRHAFGNDRGLKPEVCTDLIEADIKCLSIGPDSSGLVGEISENLLTRNKRKLSDIEDTKVRVKTKRGTLTEGRKAKRKEAKKRKRAEQNRKLGVKRLKLQPILKPKPVIYCNFYLKGRCQQGDLCKFSHDTTPLTKSQPCKYFACNSCLKGEDCPFDHELSKYPCNNYMSKGMCSRGDRCKFSHKVPVTEGSPTTPMISKSDCPSSGKSNLMKQMKMSSIPSLVPNDAPKNTTSSTPEGNLADRCLKSPTKVPKGVRFLFGKGTSNSGSKQQDHLPLEKHGSMKLCSQQKQEKLSVDWHKNALSCTQKPRLMPPSESNMMASGAVHHPALNAFASKESKSSSFSIGLAFTVPCGRSVQSEPSDASKLLEEFLFCGGS